MERRGFLKGAFGGVTAAGLIIAAKPAEIAAFASPLVRDSEVVLDATPMAVGVPQCGEHLYNGRGELVAIIKEIDLSCDSIEVSVWGDSQRSYIPGLQHFEIRARGIGSLEYTGKGFPVVRGVPR